METLYFLLAGLKPNRFRDRCNNHVELRSAMSAAGNPASFGDLGFLSAVLFLQHCHLVYSMGFKV